MNTGYLTKQKIFNVSVRLFSDMGYSEVTIRQIAREVGIKESSIYNHYPSKQSILDEILDFFLDHFPDQTDEGELEEMIRERSPQEVFRTLSLEYPEDISEFMNRITKILYMEQYHHARARRVLIECFFIKRIAMIQRVMDRLVDAQRVPPINSALFSELVCNTLAGLTQQWIHERPPERIGPTDQVTARVCLEYVMELALHAKDMPENDFTARTEAEWQRILTQ